MKKSLKKTAGEGNFPGRIFSPKPQLEQDRRKELEAKVDAGVRKAMTEYRETFRILTEYDRS